KDYALTSEHLAQLRKNRFLVGRRANTRDAQQILPGNWAAQRRLPGNIKPSAKFQGHAGGRSYLRIAGAPSRQNDHDRARLQSVGGRDEPAAGETNLPFDPLPRSSMLRATLGR